VETIEYWKRELATDSTEIINNNFLEWDITKNVAIELFSTYLYPKGEVFLSLSNSTIS